MKINKPTPCRYSASPLRSAEFDKLMSQFGALDTSQINVKDVGSIGAPRAKDQRFDNYYKDMTNRFANLSTENLAEDLTVDQRAFELQRETTQQGQADMLAAMRAGGGFNAGNIQALANQGTQAARQMTADISKQEQANQQARVAGAKDVISRQQVIAEGQTAVDLQQAQGATAVQQNRAQSGMQQAQMALQAGMANQQASLQNQQMQYQAAQDARNFQASHLQGMLSLQAGRDEAALANEQANKSWMERMFG